MPRSPEPARRKILDAALKLFATKGIAGVSMREIQLVARQGNVGAVYYHFGGKAGILRALAARELPPLVERRLALLEAARASEDAWHTAAVFVLPFAELATGSPRERWAIRFFSALHDDTSLSFAELVELTGDTATRQALELLRAHVGEDIDPAVFAERVQVATNSLQHAAALRASSTRRDRMVVDDERFRLNLVDMFLGAVVAPSRSAH